MARFDLTDEEWAIIEPLLPRQCRGPERKDERKVLDGIFYIGEHQKVWGADSALRRSGIIFGHGG